MGSIVDHRRKCSSRLWRKLTAHLEVCTWGSRTGCRQRERKWAWVHTFIRVRASVHGMLRGAPVKVQSVIQKKKVGFCKLQEGLI